MHRMINYKQVSALVALGAGALFLKQASHKDYSSDPLFDGTIELRKHANLIKLLHDLQTLKQPLKSVVTVIEQILEISAYVSKHKEAPRLRQYTIELNKHITTAKSIIANTIDAAKRERDDPEVLMACIDCTQEVVPAFDAVFESILHNAMLDAQT